MAEEKDELEVTQLEMLAELRATRALVEAMLRQLPDLAIGIAVEGLRDYQRDAERRAQVTADDRWLIHAGVVHDMAAALLEETETYIDERRRGGRYTTIQPAPIPAELRSRDCPEA